jgi:hypothetical protein
MLKLSLRSSVHDRPSASAGVARPRTFCAQRCLPWLAIALLIVFCRRDECLSSFLAEKLAMGWKTVAALFSLHAGAFAQSLKVYNLSEAAWTVSNSQNVSVPGSLPSHV